MKKIISLVLILSLVVAFPTHGFASTKPLVEASNTARDLVIETGETTITVSCIENSDGTVELQEYQNGKLLTIIKVAPNAGYYEQLLIDDKTDGRDSTWEKVLVPVHIKNTPTNEENTQRGKVTRNIGYMHYNNTAIGQTYSISCYVDEWYNPDKSIIVQGELGTAATVIASLIAALGVVYVIASDFLSEGMAAALFSTRLSAGITVVVAFDRFEVTANVVDQRIYGECTSHSGKPLGDLGAASINHISTDSIKYPGKTLLYGYTTRAWGTGALGSQMFYKVFGVAYTPTSWTGI